MYGPVDFEFRYQADVNSFYVPLLRYLQKRNRKYGKAKNTEFSREQMILWALSAFWYPLACKWLGGFTETELKQKARNAIYELQKQINYLGQVFGLDLQEFSTTVTVAAVAKSDEQTTSVPFAAGIETSHLLNLDAGLNSKGAEGSKSPDTASEILMCSGDDDLLDEAFNK